MKNVAYNTSGLLVTICDSGSHVETHRYRKCMVCLNWLHSQIDCQCWLPRVCYVKLHNGAAWNARQWTSLFQRLAMLFFVMLPVLHNPRARTTKRFQLYPRCYCTRNHFLSFPSKIRNKNYSSHYFCDREESRIWSRIQYSLSVVNFIVISKHNILFRYPATQHLGLFCWDYFSAIQEIYGYITDEVSKKLRTLSIKQFRALCRSYMFNSVGRWRKLRLVR
jgi:hypothetical protein